MRVLVTGAAGFIGTHLCDELRASGHEAIGIDRWHSAWDLREQTNVERIFTGIRGIGACIHLAAKVGRLFGEDNVAETIADNTAMTALVAKTCGERGIRLMYASTSEVYGDWGDSVCWEDRPLTRIPHNAYGLSKRHGEEFCRLYAPKDLTIMRFSMPYGPGLPAGRGRAALINFLYNARHGLPITVHRDSERSWCFISDTVRAVRMLLELNASGAYNIGRDDNALPMINVARMACSFTGASEDLIVEVDPPARQTVVKRLSTEKIRALGWSPRVSLAEGVQETLAYVEKLPAPALAA